MILQHQKAVETPASHSCMIRGASVVHTIITKESYKDVEEYAAAVTLNKEEETAKSMGEETAKIN